MTTHTVANPEYDPQEARRHAADLKNQVDDQLDYDSDKESISGQTIVVEQSTSPQPAPTSPNASSPLTATQKSFQTTTRVLGDTSTSTIPGVSTSLSAADEKVTLDIRWTVLCDLFLILIADSVYDARSRVLLENVALKLGLGWLDVVKFESRVSEALEIQEDVEKMEHQELIDGRQKSARKKRYMMLGLATLGASIFSLAKSVINLHHNCRWRISNWPISWTSRTSHWCRTGCSFHHDWYHGDYWVSCRSRRCGCHYNRRRVDWIKHCCPGNGEAHSTSKNI